MTQPLDHLTPWIGERETEASLRREEDREWKEERERRTKEHGPYVHELLNEPLQPMSLTYMIPRSRWQEFKGKHLPWLAWLFPVKYEEWQSYEDVTVETIGFTIEGPSEERPRGKMTVTMTGRPKEPDNA